MLTPLDDIMFWSRQLSEHALFMQLGLETEPFKTQATALHKDWEAARGKLTDKTTLEEAKSIVAKPTTDLRAFKVEVYNKLKSGEWSGWLFPLFVDHTRRELDYFVARVWGVEIPTNLVVAQNLRFMAEHAMFAAHLLDPAESELIRKAVENAQVLVKLQNECDSVNNQFIELSKRAGEGLDAYFTNEPVSAAKGTSIIHPVLAEHVIREGRRFLVTMDDLLGKK